MKRVLVLGLGGVGGYLGAKLALARVDPDREVIFVARGTQLAAIQERGLRYRNPEGLEIMARPTLATNDPQGLKPVDAIFLCVKSFDLETACRAVAPLASAETIVIAPLNGVDIYERVCAHLSEAIVIPSAIYLSSSLVEDGLVCHVTGLGNLALGADPRHPGYDSRPLRSLLMEAGIPYEWSDQPFLGIWNKFLFIAAYSLVCGMQGRTVRDAAENPESAELVRGIQREIAALALARGIQLGDESLAMAFERGRAFPRGVKASLQRDLEIPGVPNEGEVFGGSILRLSKEAGLRAPITEQVYGAILARH